MKMKYYIMILPLFLMKVSFARTVAERLERGVQLQVTGVDIKAAIVEFEAVVKKRG